MTKMLDATCTQEIVTCESMIVDDCTILSEGKGPSEGIMLIDELKSTYLTSNAEDIKNVIIKISSTIDNLNSTMTSITGCFAALDALPTIAGACAAFTAQIAANQVTLATIKAYLETLKGLLK